MHLDDEAVIFHGTVLACLGAFTERTYMHRIAFTCYLIHDPAVVTRKIVPKRKSFSCRNWISGQLGRRVPRTTSCYGRS